MKEPDAAPDVAGNIRAELGRRRWKYRDLANRLAGRPDWALSEEMLRRRLIGQIDFLAAELPPIADVLGMPVSRLLGEEARAS